MARRVGGGLADMFSDTVALQNEHKRKVPAEKKVKSIFDDPPSWAFPSNVSMVVISYLPTHNRNTLDIHRLITDNKMVVYGTPQEHVENKLLPRLGRIVQEAKAQGKYEPKTVFGRFIAGFSFSEQFAMFEHDYMGLFQGLGMGRRKISAARQLTFEEFQDCLYQKAFGYTQTQLDLDVKAGLVKPGYKPTKAAKTVQVAGGMKKNFSPAEISALNYKRKQEERLRLAKKRMLQLDL